MELKKDYRLAACCSPAPSQEIVGYYGHDNIVKVHASDCASITDVDPERVVQLTWDEITEATAAFEPGQDYQLLDNIDFRVLEHHRIYGIDYSLVVARKLGISKQEAFDRHKKLRDMGLVERVQPKIVQYRKGIAPNKWIKHRNHTYYDLTERGTGYLQYYLKSDLP